MSLSEELEPGVVYLVEGTDQQLQWLVAQLGVPSRLVLHPDYKTLDRLLAASNPFRPAREACLIYPYQLQLGRDKVLSSDRYQYHLPLYPHRVVGDNYYFLNASNGEGKLSEEAKALYKKVEGGPYRQLSLRDTVFYPKDGANELALRFPYRLQRADQTGDSNLPDLLNLHRESHWGTKSLILDLGTRKSLQSWGALTPQDMHRYFLPVGTRPGNVVETLNGARGPNLSCRTLVPWLMPFLERVQRNHYKGGFWLYLFALWVYLASTVWAEGDYRTGFSSFTNRRGYKQLAFSPSQKAKEKYLAFLIPNDYQ